MVNFSSNRISQKGIDRGRREYSYCTSLKAMQSYICGWNDAWAVADSQSSYVAN